MTGRMWLSGRLVGGAALAALACLAAGCGQQVLDAPVQTALSAEQIPTASASGADPYTCPSDAVVSQILGVEVTNRTVTPYAGPCSFASDGDARRAAVGSTESYADPSVPSTLAEVRSGLEDGVDPDVNGIREAPGDLGEGAVEDLTINRGYWVSCRVFVPGPDGLAWWADVMVMDDAADIPCAAAEELARQWQS